MADAVNTGPIPEAGKMRVITKIAVYVAAWLGALLATNPDGGLWSLAWMFPLGLAAFVDLRLGNDGGWGVFALCWAIYVVHAYFYFRSRSAWSRLLLLGVLVALFICNVSGCRAMTRPH